MLKKIINKVVHAIRWRVLHLYYNYPDGGLSVLKAYFRTLYISFSYPRKKESARHGLKGELIVSLTSYPPRYPSLHLTLKSLLMQDIRPDRIILWVAQKDKQQLPESVTSLVGAGCFEIRECEDLGSYKKLIPTLVEFPEAYVVLADDDLYYPQFWLSSLINSWDGNPKTIMGHRIRRIVTTSENLPLPYIQWELNIEDLRASEFNLAGSGAGMFIPPHSLDMRALDVNDFMALCPNADDIWFYWMGRLNGTNVKWSGMKMPLLVWHRTQQVALFHENVFNNQNDVKINALINKYGWPNAELEGNKSTHRA